MKAPLSLIAKMLPALEEISRLTHFGNNTKYEPDSWLEWDSWEEAQAFATQRMDSLARHVMLGMENMYSKDEETEQHHLAAAAWNALMIVTLIHKYDLGEDSCPSALKEFMRANQDMEDMTTFAKEEMWTDRECTLNSELIQGTSKFKDNEKAFADYWKKKDLTKKDYMDIIKERGDHHNG